MSIIDTFFIAFKADTKGLKDGLKDSQKESDKFTKSLGNAEVATDSVVDSFMGLVSKIGGAVVAGITLVDVLNDVRDAGNFTNMLGKFTNSIGVNAKDVAAWGEAVTVSGGSAQAFQSSLMGLTSDFQGLALTGNSAALPFLARLGISVFKANGHIKTAMQILPQLATAFHKMPKAESMAYGKHLGLDDGTIMLLQKGRKAVLAQIATMKSLDGVTKKSTKISAKYITMLDKSKFALRGIAITIGDDILPALTWFSEKITEISKFMQDNKVATEAFFIAVGSAITVYMLPALTRMGIGIWAALSPIILMGAGVIALGAAIAIITDDIYNYIEGNSSLLGQILDKYPKAKKIVNEFFKGVGEGIREDIHLLKEFVRAILHPIDALEKLKKAYNKKYVNNKQPLMQQFGTGLHEDYDWGKSMLGKAQHYFNFAATTQLPNMNNPPSHVTQNISINIDNKDPHETAKQVQQVLNKEHQDAVIRHSTGVKI
jgi:hypothetical protein